MWIARKLYEALTYICTIMLGYELGKFIIKFGYVLHGRFLSTEPYDFRSLGQWVVITGATDKMGHAFVEYFGERGIDLILIGYPVDELEQIGEISRELYKVRVMCLSLDFKNNYDRNMYGLVDQTLKHLDVGVLVNAVTQEAYYPEVFMNLPDEEFTFKAWYNHSLYSQMIFANIFPVSYLCKIILPGMAEKKKGVIINISAMNSILPSPYFTLYAATKTYVNKLTECLRDEYSEYGIIFLCLTPGHVTGRFENNTQNSTSAPVLCPDAKTYVNNALRNLGVRDQTCGYIPHSIMYYFLRGFYCVSSRLSRKLMRNLARIYSEGSFLQFRKKKKNKSENMVYYNQ